MTQRSTTMLLTFLILAAGTASAQDLPRRPVRFVVPYALGAINDAAPGWGVAVPVATPKPIVDRIHASVVGILRQPEVVERYAAQSVEIAATSPAEATAHMHSELQRWTKAVKFAQAKVD